MIRNCKLLKRGVVDEPFIQSAVSSLPNSIRDWLVVGPCKDETLTGWAFCEDRDELRDALSDRVGLKAFIFDEPDWLHESDTISAYVPDADGIVRLGCY